MKSAGMILLLFILATATSLSYFLPAFAAEPGPVIIVTPHGGGNSTPPPPCVVSITASLSQLSYNGLPRNNPDGSYYPGDAFSLLLSIGANHCTSTSVSVAGDSSVSPICTTCTSTRVEVSPYSSAGTHIVRASVSGSGPGGGGFATTSIPVVVADPRVTIKVTPANVTDKDGYLMRNADSTYYINDAIALKYEVDYAFKEQRRGVVEPEVTRTHPYAHFADLDCLQEYCTLVVPATSATSEYRATFVYASGISVANATATQGLGPKVFQFDVKLRNAGVDSGMGTTQRYTATIVNYAPRFVAYPYLDLKDGGDVSYDKELMIALHYLGSDDDDGAGGVQASRRTKINSYTNEVDASVFGVGDVEATKKAGLSWLSVAPVDHVITTTAAGKNAMIERAGYVKLIMKMMHYRPETFSTMQNVTALPIFYSKDFAGKNSLVLFGVGYVYPDKQFANTISVGVLDGSGAVVDKPVSLEVSPASISTTTVCDYIDGHAKRYTGDAMFPKIALSDVYSCSPATISGTGTVTMHADMTGLLIPKVYDILYPGGIQTMPANLVLESPASQSLMVTVAGQSRTYTLPVYSYERDVEITANIGTNNALNVVRDGSTVTVQSPDNFGSIIGLQVNGTAIAQSCTDGCALDIPGAANIVASNEWGGKASASVAAPAKIDSTVARPPSLFVEDGGSVIIMALFGVVGAIIAGVALRKYASYLGELFS